MKCKYPKLEISKVPSEQEKKKSTTKRHNPTDPHIRKKCNIVVLYSQGLRENYKSICNKYGIQVHFKEAQNLKNLLVSPKDKDAITTKAVLYTDLSVTRMNVEINTQGSHPEPLEKDRKNI